jgi:hypothetical protein
MDMAERACEAFKVQSFKVVVAVLQSVDISVIKILRSITCVRRIVYLELFCHCKKFNILAIHKKEKITSRNFT